MPNWLAVGLGGFAGSIIRFQIGLWCYRWSMQRFGRGYPIGTLVVNAAGCLLIGLLMVLFQEKFISERSQRLLVAGCLGALTTFSTFSFEVFEFIRESRYELAAGYVILSLLIGVLAVAAGHFLARCLVAG